MAKAVDLLYKKQTVKLTGCVTPPCEKTGTERRGLGGKHIVTLESKSYLITQI